MEMMPVCEDIPKPIAPSAYNEITNFHPLELARQITLAEFAIYKTIQPTECLNQAIFPFCFFFFFTFHEGFVTLGIKYVNW